MLFLFGGGGIRGLERREIYPMLQFPSRMLQFTFRRRPGKDRNLGLHRPGLSGFFGTFVGFRVWGVGFRGWGLGFRVQGLGFRV